MNKLVFNLDIGALLNYRIGATIPAEFHNENYLQLDRGFSINVYNNYISSILVCFRNGYREFKEFDGAVVVNGQEYILSCNSSFNDILKIFGHPTESWDDGVEQCAAFKKDDKEIEIIWHVDGIRTLDYISIELA